MNPLHRTLSLAGTALLAANSLADRLWERQFGHHPLPPKVSMIPRQPVTADVEMWVMISEDVAVMTTLTARLSYNPAAPYAVSATFPDGCDGTTVSWELSRELLVIAQKMHAGEGDVQAWAIRETFYLALSSPDGKALLTCPLVAIEAFLNLTLASVPLGTETVDIDAVVAELLGAS